MKKVLLVLALVVAYGVSMANTAPKVICVEKAKVTVVADSDDFSIANEDEKDKKKTKKKEATKACCGDKATVDKEATGCSGAKSCTKAQKKSCAESGKTCGGEKAATTTKSCCGDKKK